MSTALTVRVHASHDAPDITFSIMIDGHTIDHCVCQKRPQQLQVALPDHDAETHTVTFQLAGKTRYHTQLDSQGRMIQDVLVTVDSIEFNGLDLLPLWRDESRYWHDHNGNSSRESHDFHGDLGCNGDVVMQYRAPIYMWLMECMP